MKTVAVMLMLAIGCLALSANATPVPDKTDTEIKKNTDIVTSRQAAPAVPPPATEDDDDDDDDDDDITDIAGDYEEEEEDEADGDDDEDEDYLERFIEDILGGDDDDDDDDDDEGTSSVVEASPPASPVQTQSVVPAGVQSDLNAAGEDSQVSVESVQAADINADSTGSYEEEEADAQPEGQAVSIEHSEPIVNPVIVHQVVQPIATQPAESDDDDDDDEDDDDDIDLDITGDEDSDEEEDDDEDDADEEADDEIEDIADIARSARAMESDTGDAIYVAKYNRFVDSILGRINKILKTNYDPVTVRLASPSAKSSKTKSKKKKTKTKDKSNMKMTSRHAITNESTTPASIENQPTTINKADTMTTTEEPISSRGFIATTVKPKRVTVKNKINKISTKDTSNKNKNKTKQAKPSSKPRARATLYGLSSLKRSGDVSVNMMSDHTTIRTKFTLGPLILKVEKEFGRAAKKELKSATATTAEMSGKLSLRVLHGGAATLHSIRVLQPKQVRVDSPDDHDRTREFVWRRSSHIAHVVSQKLSSATRSMLRPPPQISK